MWRVQLTFELDIKLTMSVNKLLAGHIQLRGWRVEGWGVSVSDMSGVGACSGGCQLILIYPRSLSLGPEYEDLQHYDHNYIHHRDFSLITGLCTLNNFSVYLFASLLVGLFIVIMNVCDGENTSEY